ncbi:MAG: UDP-N-acetylmuramoyl-L-alanine--D-glutamate ligase [Marinilabiliales bacterium]|nr:MAG: UDP-N-acetylmuramoyl-L-alanine--D-glutamate ligase [Marinilabiliales bacterium]
MQKRLVILGSGESGTGTAVLAKMKGFDVFVSDFGSIKQEYKEVLDKNNIAWEEKRHSEDLILNATEIVKSPGIPDTVPMILSAATKGIPVVSEIEFAARYTDAKMICITGSNGKTTTTLLTYHILKNAGLNVGLAGNVGKSFALQVATENYDYFVLELSSFQLDGMYKFKADIAILMNITPDHLDRYDYDFNKYVDSKFRILQNMTHSDYLIYCDDDEVVTRELKKRKPDVNMLGFSTYHSLDKGGFCINEQFNINLFNTSFTMSTLELALQGRHNAYNSMAAGIAASVLKIRKKVIRDSLADFQGVEHRLEPVIKVHGIHFINDSKATNVNSTWYALESVQRPIIWILGGVDKGNDYSMLNDLVKSKVKAIICLGMDNNKILEEFTDIVPTITEAGSMIEAVRKAYYLGHNGDTVLLSPACASFDLFDNYEDRGHQFKAAVREL